MSSIGMGDVGEEGIKNKGLDLNWRERLRGCETGLEEREAS